MARFAFAFSNTSARRPLIPGVLQAAAVVLENGNVVVNSLSQLWPMSVLRAESGIIEVTGGDGTNKFRYSLDDGVTWTEETSPYFVNAPGEVLFETLGSVSRPKGIGILEVLALTGTWQETFNGQSVRWWDTGVWDDKTDELFIANPLNTNSNAGDLAGTISPLPDGGAVTYTLSDTFGGRFAISGANVIVGATPLAASTYNLIANAVNVSGWVWSVPCTVNVQSA